METRQAAPTGARAAAKAPAKGFRNPFKFLFKPSNGNTGKAVEAQRERQKAQPQRQQQQQQQQPQGKGQGATMGTDSYTAGSSMMSIDPAEGDETKCPPGSNGGVAGEAGKGGSREISGYEIQDTLGKGMSGKVKRGYNRASGQYVALKIIDKATTPRRVLQMLSTEIAAMRTLSAHPHILSLLHYELAAAYPKKSGGKRDVVLLALELAEGGELFDFMMYTGAFQENLARAIFQQMASALAFCHERGIYHRDIKPENLLLDSNFQLKVADFGLAAMRSNPQDLLRTECGTRSYMAPEVLARQQYDGQKSDCWSAGVVLFIMLSGNPPFQMARQGDWWFNQFTEGRPDRFWKSHKRYSPHFPEAAQELLTRVFTPNPANRPSLKDLLSDPWVSSNDLTPEQIKAELAQRKAKIIKEKEAERERAKQKRAAGQFGAGGDKDFDPEKVKHRAVALGDDGSGMVVCVREDPAPPAKAADLSSITSLFTAEGPATAFRRARETLTMMNARILPLSSEKEKQHPYTLKAMVPVDLDQVEVEVRVLSVPGEDTTVLVLSRVRGDLLVFQRAFRAFAANTFDLHGDTASEVAPLGPSPLDDDDDDEDFDGEGPAVGQTLEASLSDAPEMI